MSSSTIKIGSFIIIIISSWLVANHANNDTDHAALLAFKSQLVLQPNHILSNHWSSNTYFCHWLGVSCFNGRVRALRLSGLALQGRISKEIANLTHLVVLDLSSNHLEGALPDELGYLQQLRLLNVSRNFLQDSIPANISRCLKLEVLYLFSNMFAGSIPEELGLLKNLRMLSLYSNNLTGSIPTSIGNLSKLEYLYLHENQLVDEIPGGIGHLTGLVHLFLYDNDFTGSIPASLFNISMLQNVDWSGNRLSGKLPESLGNQLPSLQEIILDDNQITGSIPASLSNATRLEILFFEKNDLEGNIPDELGKLLELQWFGVRYNRISGNIPPSIFNISSLQVLGVTQNYLKGHLPADLGDSLPNLEQIFLSHNQFSGEIPSAICNATKLIVLDVTNNSFSGPVPEMLGNLRNLERLYLQLNLLGNNPRYTHLNYLNSLVNCRKLEYLILSFNPFNGNLPDLIGNLSSNLRIIDAKSCDLTGSIPQGMGNLSSLNWLRLENNGLEGSIPSSFVGLQNLERLDLTSNKLRGNVATELCGINGLGELYLDENSFSGPVPICLGNLTELRKLSIAANNFSSIIPSNFWRLVKLESLNLSKNLLDGSLPSEIGNLQAVRIMDMSSNNFSGELPSSLGSLQRLVSLDMSKNSFQGPVPSAVSNLIALEALNLSSNALSGTIPEALESLQYLKYLNLSFNRLEGEIPHKGVFAGLGYQSLMGNSRLCGAPKLHFPICPAQVSTARRKRSTLVLKITIPVVVVIFLLALSILTWIRLSRKKNAKGNVEAVSSPRVGYRIITFNELVRATESFSGSNILGSGGSGTVYKGTLSDGTVAAIKVLNVQWERALRNFDAECKILSSARHRNLVKIISSCSNIDFKAMVLEFMPNGSLDKWLHSQDKYLSLLQRLDIVIDVALAMEYLHHDYVNPIVHCDLKPSNVLLDEDMTAHVADFGIAKILSGEQSGSVTKTLGTIGYIAPEYGLDGHVSTSSDVYSYGILLLETFTRKKPTDGMFEGDLSLRQWVMRSFPDSIMEVLDSDLCDEVRSVEEGKRDQIEKVVASLIHVALPCLKESPEERTDMRNVVVQLKKIRMELTPRRCIAARGLTIGVTH